MNRKWCTSLWIMGIILFVLAAPVKVSAKTMDYGLQEFSIVGTYRTILDQKIETEAIPLKQTLDQIDVMAKISSFPTKRIYEISDKDFQILSRIVEAEATDKDAKSKILVANVVLNRMKSGEFPDTIEEVVFQRANGAVQFSPTADGRYESVEVTENSKECAERALKGEDYSEGALYFVERSSADPDNVNWFDRALTKLFEYEGHAFYK